jgi:hypothetical protein
MTRAAKEYAAMCKATGLDVVSHLSECPECRYQNGFHVAFKRVEPNGHEDRMAVQLICPSCSAVFDVGLRVCLETDELAQAGASP